MNSQVLARSWRPQSFTELVGQEHVVRALSNALSNDRLHHAYLFSGTRGVGKTTLARIFAKCLNCQLGVTAAPCNVCPACTAIRDGRFIDLIEVDAASRTKVEDTRELLDNVQYSPSQGRFKIYLIDEVHMLSNHSFNALLKTLEEPPPHVKFLLATTDPQRLPVTILSRCLQFNLKRIPDTMIAQQLEKILLHEKINYQPTALQLIAKAADGSMRDSLSLLDQALAYSQYDISEQHINELLGTTAKADIELLLEALANKNSAALFALSEQFEQNGVDYTVTLQELLSQLHQLAIAHALNNQQHLSAKLATIYPVLSAEDVQLFYQIGVLGKRDLPLAPSLRIGFEMTLLRMMTFLPAKPSPINFLEDDGPTTSVTSAADDTINSTAAAITTSDKVTDNIILPKLSNSLTIATSMLDDTSCDTAPLLLNELNWLSMLPQLSLQGPTLALAENCIIDAINDTSIELALSAQYAMLLNARVQSRLAEAITAFLHKPLHLIINIKTLNEKTPAELKQEIKAARLLSAEQTIHNDQTITSLLSAFEAQIIPNTLKLQE